MRIDTHIHLFPSEAGADPHTFASQYGEAHWLKLVAPDDRPSIQGWADTETCLRHMDAAGIDIAVLQGWYWENPETCRLHNRLYADILEKWSDRFKAFACFHPEFLDSDSAYLPSVVEQGFSGWGELLPQAQAYSMEDPRFVQLAEFAQKHGMWINFHATEPAGGQYPGRVDTPLQDYLEFAKKFPELQIILSHLGGGLAFYAQNPGTRRHLKNVYFDTAAWPLIYSMEAAAAAIKLAGPRKCLYGTDYPLRTLPRNSLEDQMSKNLNAFLDLPMGDSDALQSILHNGHQIGK